MRINENVQEIILIGFSPFFEHQESDELGQGDFFKFFPGFFFKMLNKVIDYPFFKTQLNSNILTKDYFAFKNVLICKNQLNTGH